MTLRDTLAYPREFERLPSRGDSDQDSDARSEMAFRLRCKRVPILRLLQDDDSIPLSTTGTGNRVRYHTQLVGMLPIFTQWTIPVVIHGKVIPQREHTEARLGHIATMMNTALLVTEDNESFAFINWQTPQLHERVIEAVSRDQCMVIRATTEEDYKGLLDWNVEDLNKLLGPDIKLPVQSM